VGNRGILLCAGVITAGAAIAVNFGVENISGFKFWATLTLLDQGRAVASFLVYVLINTILVAGSVMITVYYAPAAAGSGIAEVKVRWVGWCKVWAQSSATFGLLVDV
jgi:chloride channel 7